MYVHVRQITAMRSLIYIYITLYSPGYNNIIYYILYIYIESVPRIKRKTTKFDTMKTYVYIIHRRRNALTIGPSSRMFILFFFFFLAKLCPHSCHSGASAAVAFVVCTVHIIHSAVYFVSHTDYTNMYTKDILCVLSAEKCARIPGDNQSTTTQRFL